ncbi:GMC family oxidoreductase [Patulibacter defluvii]|uniref:GMC family oxidoreductase n=1 Tax=Patulibacter defluvii TaxID=3095358 RepID=UPI002A74AD8D|nr:GMC family oxidoreductase [Patulibacter sp. DM4]
MTSSLLTSPSAPLDAPQRSALEAACDALLPSLTSDASGEVARFFADGAIERGIAAAVVEAVPALPVDAREALVGLLDRLADEGFADAALDERAARLVAAGAQDGPDRFAVRQLKTMTFGMLFGQLAADGRNPAWGAIEFPGPRTDPPSPEQAPKTLPVETLAPGDQTLTADVCVIGSGAGGSVIAARLAAAGRSVLVLEAGAYRNEADFRQIESVGAEMYLGNGIVWSDGGQLGLLAGSALGGGTVINSMVCLPTPDEIRRDWTARGLDGLDGDEWDGCVDRVWQRLNVNTEATSYNRNTELMVSGLGGLGFQHQPLPRNVSLDDDPAFCGYCNAGCQQGCKQSTMKTYLEDAARDGARFVVHATVERITTEGGRATGVEATVEGPDGTTRLRVDAPTVVVAAGGIESPAVLLRSGIGGDAAGRYLRVHPAWMVYGVYPEPVEAWNGQIQSAVSMDLTHCESDTGFLVESLTLSPSTTAGQTAFSDPRRHREELLKLRRVASWHGVSHDHGHGRVVLDRDGQALVQWRLEDEVDHRVAVRAHVELARIHREAGADEVFTFHWNDRRWRRGEDFDAYVAEIERTPADEFTAYSAHQMGSCRLGADPATSVADGRGQLHDVEGVWIGDASGLPTAPGVNPMITIMALAERTATRMLEA